MEKIEYNRRTSKGESYREMDVTKRCEHVGNKCNRCRNIGYYSSIFKIWLCDDHRNQCPKPFITASPEIIDIASEWLKMNGESQSQLYFYANIICRFFKDEGKDALDTSIYAVSYGKKNKIQ